MRLPLLLLLFLLLLRLLLFAVRSEFVLSLPWIRTAEESNILDAGLHLRKISLDERWAACIRLETKSGRILTLA